MAIQQTAKLSYLEKAALCANPAAHQLLTLIAKKKTNLCVAADVASKQELLTLADQLGPYICLLKTHIDIIQDFDADLLVQLTELSAKHQFLLFEDRKFVDIGQTVKSQYLGGIYQIAAWAHFTNVLPLAGPGIIEGLKQIGLPLQRGLIILAEMSSKGSLATGNYTEAAIEMGLQNRDFVVGFLTRNTVVDDPSFIIFTTGVQFQSKNDLLGQQYLTPEEAILDRNADVIIVGRGIYEHDNPVELAAKYRDLAWHAYLKKVNL